MGGGSPGRHGLIRCVPDRQPLCLCAERPLPLRRPSGRFVVALTANAPLLVSIAIQSVGGVGDACGALTGVLGYDPVAGVSLSTGLRPGSGHLMSHQQPPGEIALVEVVHVQL